MSSEPLTDAEFAAIVADIEQCPFDATSDDPAARGWKHAARLTAEVRRLYALGLGPATQDLAARHCDRMERGFERASAERAEVLRRVSVALGRYGAADFDDPLAALDDIIEDARRRDLDRVAEANALRVERAENERIHAELEETRDFEREALVDLGRADGNLRLLAKAARDGGWDLAEQIARDVLDGIKPDALENWHVGRDGKAPLAAWPLLVLGEAMHEEIKRIGAENFVGWTLTLPALEIEVIVQRVEGKTPTMLHAEVKAERDHIRADFEALQAEAARVVKVYEESGGADALDVSTDLHRAITALRDGGREGWWKR